MAKKYQLTVAAERKNRFDIFGLFTKAVTLTPEEQKLSAQSIAREWMNSHYKNLGLASADHTVTGYEMKGGNLIVSVTVA